MRGPRIIGYRRDGSPIAEVAGGDGLVDPIALAEATRRAYGSMRVSGGGGLALHPGEGQQRAGEWRTPGEALTESPAYQDWMRRYPGGAPPEGTTVSSDPTEVGALRGMLGMLHATERLRAERLTPDRFRALLTSADASAGTLVRPSYQGLLEPGLVRPLTIRQLVTVVPLASDLAEYTREVSRVSAAAPVEEAESANTVDLEDATGRKPEGALTFEVRTEPIRTIAEWVPATRRILSDAPQLRAYVDQYLTDDLALELEDQMLAGPGGGENFLGVLNDPGIQGTGSAGDGLNALDRLRRAKRLVRTGGRTNATAIVVNPEDAEMLDTLKAEGDGHYFIPGGPYGGGTSTTWGLPQIESEGVPAGTAVVADWRRAILFDRESTTITVGTVNDDFIRNIVRVLGELRAGFGIIRPAAFVAVDLAAAA